MTHPQERDPLEPMLLEAETDLAERLEEACAMRDVHDESTAELMRLEETLLDAARAAKQAVSVRRRRRSLSGPADRGRHDDADDPNGGHAEGGPVDGRLSTAPRSDESSSVRDFVDEGRVEWRVWEVIPSQNLGSVPGPHHQLGDYQAGWLAFEAVGSGQRRRLRDYPRDWNKLSNDALEALLARAEAARAPRRPSGPSDERRS